jgi:uncharacterized tellurite resistance protein B-like protein
MTERHVLLPELASGRIRESVRSFPGLPWNEHCFTARPAPCLGMPSGGPGNLMFDALKNFLAEIGGTGPAPERSFDEADYRLAAAALLIHVANADGHVDQAERLRLQAIVEERFALDADTARRLIAAAEESEREAVDLYHFTATLKRTLDEAGRRQVVELMWDMAYADGEAHELEENIVWRVAELLGVPARERMQLKHRAEATGGEVAGVEPGPWSAAGSKA